jgi:hypothetical protein
MDIAMLRHFVRYGSRHFAVESARIPKLAGSSTPFSPPSCPATGFPNGFHPKSKFLALRPPYAQYRVLATSVRRLAHRLLLLASCRAGLTLLCQEPVRRRVAIPWDRMASLKNHRLRNGSH